MIDYFVGFDGYGHPIYASDIYYNVDYIGYKDINGNIILY